MANQLVEDLLTAKISAAMVEAKAVSKITHNGTKGRLREIIIAGLIEPLLPPPWRVASGIICSHEETLTNQSGQEDIIIFDPSLLPPFFSNLEQVVIPIEAVICTIEVKSTLNSQAVQDSIKHAEKINQLDTLFKPRHRKPKKKTTKANWIAESIADIGEEKKLLFQYPSHFVFAGSVRNSVSILLF